MQRVAAGHAHRGFDDRGVAQQPLAHDLLAGGDVPAVLGPDPVPPGLKLTFWNIERSRCDQMVKDDIMLFAPAECAEMIEIIIIKKFVGKRF